MIPKPKFLTSAYKGELWKQNYYINPKLFFFFKEKTSLLTLDLSTVLSGIVKILYTEHANL